MTKKFFLPSRKFFFLLSFLFFAGLSAAKAAEPSVPLTVAVSIPAQKYFVLRLAGEAVQVESMLPPNANHETYEPSMKQLRALSQAKIYFRLGHPKFTFESLWLDRVLQSVPSLRVESTAAGIPVKAGDAHYWTSPQNAVLMVHNISAALQETLPEKASAIAENETVLVAEIRRLDDELRERLDKHRGCEFLVYHPAWGYFAEHYGLRQVAVEADNKEPGMTQLQRLLDAAKRDHVQTFVTEPSSPGQLVATIAEELGTFPFEIDPTAENWPKALSNLAEYLDSHMQNCVPHDPSGS
jgi:zinc transport system substrate-binding protein